MRRKVASELERKKLSQRQLAIGIDVTPQYLSDMLSGKRSNMPEKWKLVLEALELELVAVPKGKDLSGCL